MSNRTLIEINHDYWAHIDARPRDFIETLQSYLSGGSGRASEALERYGIRVITLRHHSENFNIPDGAEGFARTAHEGGKL